MWLSDYLWPFEAAFKNVVNFRESPLCICSDVIIWTLCCNATHFFLLMSLMVHHWNAKSCIISCKFPGRFILRLQEKKKKKDVSQGFKESASYTNTVTHGLQLVCWLSAVNPLLDKRINQLSWAGLNVTSGSVWTQCKTPLLMPQLAAASVVLLFFITDNPRSTPISHSVFNFSFLWVRQSRMTRSRCTETCRIFKFSHWGNWQKRLYLSSSAVNHEAISRRKH